MSKWVKLVVAVYGETYEEAVSRLLKGEWDEEKTFDVEGFEPDE